MKKISYIMFHSADEFEKWQDENPFDRPSQITPVINGIDFEDDQDDRNGSSFGKTDISVFVVYVKGIE